MMPYPAVMDVASLAVLATIALFAAPGPTNALLFAAGAGRGFARSLVLAGVVLAAYTLAVGSARLALEPLIASHDVAARALRLVLGLYVLWLALRLWRSTLNAAIPVAIDAGSLFLTTLLNPKALVLAFLLLPPAGAALASALAVAVGAILVSSLLWIGLGHAEVVADDQVGLGVGVLDGRRDRAAGGRAEGVDHDDEADGDRHGQQGGHVPP
ncbi:MAG TPA: hypothetical protein PK812_08385, partial [Beijerinckiaceae bacterium]|nr:hypothetical protein [Beijerinckiaceae bacterium]